MTNSDMIMQDSLLLFLSVMAATGVHVLDRELGAQRPSPWLVDLGGIALLVLLLGCFLPSHACTRCRTLPFAVTLVGHLSIITPFALSCGLGLSMIRRVAKGDRARLSRACARCGYDLQGSASKRCPECGALAPLP
jgi:hypothetical protein